MDASIKSGTGFSLGIISAMVVTASLFMTLPMLTQLQPTPSTTAENESILSEKWKPSPVPSETRDDTKRRTPPEATIVQKRDRPQREHPKIDIQRGNVLTGINGGIEIDIPSTSDATAIVPYPTYKPEEVDQPPKALRSFSPQYPYLAKRDNIEGWVMLRFVVDTEGIAGKVEVVAADPAGIFDEAALKAVAQYRFKPAIKNGEVVNCITKQRIRFTLD